MSVTIYHNTGCGTPRNTLASIRGASIDPEVLPYLDQPPSHAEPVELDASAGLGVRQALRIKDAPFHELGLDDQALSDGALLNAMLAHPVLINQPFARSPHGVRLCRPSKVVLDILPEVRGLAFTKEAGEVVLDAEGRRRVAS